MAHAHELQACCRIQVTQQAVVGLVRNGRLADGAGRPAPQTQVLQHASTSVMLSQNASVKSQSQHPGTSLQNGSVKSHSDVVRQEPSFVSIHKLTDLSQGCLCLGQMPPDQCMVT